eukprot:12975451-Ditylum_brightwellii.AAC.1
MFSASLPSGTYVAEFQDAACQVVWPCYIQECWDSEPACNDYPTAADITLVVPQLLEGECDDIVLNGNMEGSYKPWKHNGGK